MTERRMRIGEFAEAAGVSVDAIRFYERRGILHLAPRTPSGYRTFDQRDLDRVRLAQQFQHLGLTIEEIVDAFTAHDADGASCSSERWRLDQVQDRIEARIVELQRTRQLIMDAQAACDLGRCQLAAQPAL